MTYLNVYIFVYVSTRIKLVPSRVPRQNCNSSWRSGPECFVLFRVRQGGTDVSSFLRMLRPRLKADTRDSTSFQMQIIQFARTEDGHQRLR